MREVRVALLEADVALPVVKDFLVNLQQKATGQKIIDSIQPAQQVVKIVHDALVELLSGEKSDDSITPASRGLNLATTPPAVILMAGLQGSGKTTTSGKLAQYLMQKQRKKVMLASLDIYRPAAQEQLEILAKQTGAVSLPIVVGEKPLQIARRALSEAKLLQVDVLILDSAGRLQIDAELMQELQQVKTLVAPIETLLVADALTGQEAVNIAKGFDSEIGVTGIILTRFDGDGRGGAALSMRAVTGKPIKFIGVGEKLDALEEFHAERIAGRILGMGDVVSLVERAAEQIDQKSAEAMLQKMQSGKFDFNDLLMQLRQVQKMGGLSSLMGLMPGMGKIKAQMGDKFDSAVNEKNMKRQQAIILSMTPAERKNPDIIKAGRKRRIAAGSSMRVEDVNRLIKNLEEMQKMMGQLKKMGPMGLGRLMGKRPF